MRGLWRIRRFLEQRRLSSLADRARRTVAGFPRRREQVKHPFKAPLIVTLTSYTPRFPGLSKTLISLLDQSMAADRTVLWIAEDEIAQLPGDVRDLEAHGLEIRACADLKSFKKLIPALSMWEDACFVTADDDVFYPDNWLESLVAAAVSDPGCVIGSRVHVAHLDAGGRMKPYSSWQLATGKRRITAHNARLFPTGVGGILYPPRAFAKGVLDEDAFMKLCPHGDDIWFFWMARMAGTGHRRSRDWFDIYSWSGSQEVALYNDNLLGNRNDLQIRAMEDHFGPVP